MNAKTVLLNKLEKRVYDPEELDDDEFFSINHLMMVIDDKFCDYELIINCLELKPLFTLLEFYRMCDGLSHTTKDKLYMHIETGNVGRYDDWFYDDEEDGVTKNGIDENLDCLVEVVWDFKTNNWKQA